MQCKRGRGMLPAAVERWLAQLAREATPRQMSSTHVQKVCALRQAGRRASPLEPFSTTQLGSPCNAGCTH